MSRSAGFIIWFGVAFAIYAGAHYYTWARLIRAAALPAPWHLTLSVLIVALSISVPLAFLLMRLMGWSGSGVLLWPAFGWLGLLLFLLLILVGVDVTRGIAMIAIKLTGSEALADPARRLFLSRTIAVGATALAAGLAGLSIYSAVAGPRLRRQRVTLARWPRALDGYTIAQLSDLHIGRTIGRSYVADVVRQINALSPDLIAITGDLVDGSPQRLGDAVAPVAELRARHGVFFVTGNHDHYSGVEPWLTWLRQRDIRVLRNERVRVGDGEDGFDLAGVDDSYFGADVERALADRDPQRAVVLLAHQPQEIRSAAKLGVGLQLSGHTHGGQIWPFTWFARGLFRFVAGLFRVGETQLYVSRGSGYVGPPMRLGAPSEITLIELRSPSADAP